MRYNNIIDDINGVYEQLAEISGEVKEIARAVHELGESAYPGGSVAWLDSDEYYTDRDIQGMIEQLMKKVSNLEDGAREYRLMPAQKSWMK